MGLNCSACHTSEITYKGKRMRLEGGATLADAQGFIDALNRALVETRDNPEKQDRFARAVLRGADTPAEPGDAEKCTGGLCHLAAEAREGQCDAAALWLCAARCVRIHLQQGGGADAGGRPAAQSVRRAGELSVPLEHPPVRQGAVERHRGAQADRADLRYRRIRDAMSARSSVSLPMSSWSALALEGYTSSANVTNLDRLERLLRQLKPPAWPQAVLGPIDPAKRAAGPGAVCPALRQLPCAPRPQRSQDARST